MGDIRADYDAGRNNRFKRKRVGVNSMGSGADYHYRNAAAFYSTIELAEDLYRNHSKVGQGVRRLCANIIQDGFQYDPDTGKEAVNQTLAQRMEDWSGNAEECDKAGEDSFLDQTWQVFRAQVVAGDIFGLFDRDGSIALVEAHRAKTPRNTKKNVVMGVLLNKHRRRKELWVTKDEIDPTRSIAKVSDVNQYPFRDALGNRQIVQVYWAERPTQTRGVSAFQQAILTADHADDLEFAQLLKAQMQACYTIFRQLEGGSTPQAPGQRGEQTEETRPDGTTRTIEGLGPAMEIFGYPGEKLQGFSANVPNAEYFQHMNLILSTIACNLDLPVQVLLLDATGANFSGQRWATDQAKFRWKQLQSRLTRRWYRPVTEWKIRQWLAEDSTLRRITRGAGVDPLRHMWTPPSWPYIEPLKDSQADLLQMRNALSSPRRVAMRRSMKWPKLVAEIVEDTSLLVEQAFKRAEELNKANPGLDITWREIASLPTPDGVTVTLDSGEEPEPGPSKKGTADAT
jgi:capsid protein